MHYFFQGKASRGPDEMIININSKMVVTEQFWAYGFLSYIAETGGFVGLFLGYSVLQLRDLFPLLSSHNLKRKK